MMRYIAYLLVVCLLLGFTNEHPIHNSLTQIRVNPTSHRLEISVRVFIDDFSDAVSQHAGKKMFLGEKKEHPKAAHYIDAYLVDHLEVQLDKNPIQWTMLGSEPSEDRSALWVFLESDSVNTSFVRVKLNNSLHMELFEDQKNLISFIHTGRREKMARCDASHPIQTLNF